ncbi:hypothetical protein ACIPHN_22920, partial [Herbaspirillum sp. NPDC087042]
MTQSIQQIIDQAWEDRASLSPKSAPADIRNAVAEVIGSRIISELENTPRERACEAVQTFV